KDSIGNVTNTYFHQGNSNDATSSEQGDVQSKIGKTYRTETYDNSNNLYSLLVNIWSSFSRGGGANFVGLATTTALSYDGNSSHRDTATENTYDISSGNPTRITNWGEVTG